VTPSPGDLDVAERRAPRSGSLARALAAAGLTTAIVTGASWLLPEQAATVVGLVFLGATWLLVLRGDEHLIREHGLSLGGLLEPLPIDARRVARDALRASAWALAMAALFFPLFWFGYRLYFGVHAPFHLRLPPSLADEVMGQVLVTALPEEAFFRGYLQSELDRAWPPRWPVLGARLGPSWLVSAAIFAVGHVLTVPSPARVAVFFPALVFGWLRARTRGVGASVVFHAACNLFSASLARGYGLVP
jgi:membrane protease YdiL (CAAX protease family)